MSTSARNGTGALLSCAGIGMGVGVATFSLVEGYVAVPIVVIFLAVLCIAAVIIEIRRCGDFLTAAGMFAMGVFAFFVIRPIGIYTQQSTTAGAEVDSRALSIALESAMAISLVQVLVLVLCAFAVYWTLSTYQPKDRSANGFREFVERNQRMVNEKTSAVLVWLAIVVAMFSAIILIGRSGGLVEHFGSVANRSSSLRGVNFLVYSYLPLLAALLVHTVNRRVVGRSIDAASVFGVAALLVVTALSGGRGPLIFGAVLPLLILLQTGRRRISQGSLAVVLGLGALVALAYAVLVRERTFRADEVGVRHEDSLLATVWDRALSGSEFRPLDSLIRLNEAASVGELSLQNGNTYLASLAWFVPRGLWPGKPGGGANTWFTQTLLPRFYGPERVETSVSVVGEAYLNFSWIGLALVGIFVGCLLFFVSRSRVYQGGILRVALVAGTSPIIVSFLRGDAYQNVGVFLTLTVLIIGSYFVSQHHTLDATGGIKQPERAF